ncbi:MAG: hypothetical protein FJW09_07690 [Actinobacteria bacterium]|nr:hypothetical protein [Actinomycetota bacterium]
MGTSRRAVGGIALVLVGGLTLISPWWGPTASASAPPVTDPPPTDVPVEDGSAGTGDGTPNPTVVTSPPNTVPASCVIPTPVRATFVGTIVAADRRTARYRIDQMRGGTLEGYEASGLVDVLYGEDVRFLALGDGYIVAVGVSAETGALYSKVRDPELLFGGSQIIGMNSSDADCPEIEDAVRTLTVDGGPVESGVWAPLSDARGRLARAILLPVLWVFGGLLGLATLRAVVVIVWRSGRRFWDGEPRP